MMSTKMLVLTTGSVVGVDGLRSAVAQPLQLQRNDAVFVPNWRGANVHNAKPRMASVQPFDNMASNLLERIRLAKNRAEDLMSIGVSRAEAIQIAADDYQLPQDALRDSLEPTAPVCPGVTPAGQEYVDSADDNEDLKRALRESAQQAMEIANPPSDDWDERELQLAIQESKLLSKIPGDEALSLGELQHQRVLLEMKVNEAFDRYEDQSSEFDLSSLFADIDAVDEAIALKKNEQ